MRQRVEAESTQPASRGFLLRNISRLEEQQKHGQHFAMKEVKEVRQSAVDSARALELNMSNVASEAVQEHEKVGRLSHQMLLRENHAAAARGRRRRRRRRRWTLACAASSRAALCMSCISSDVQLASDWLWQMSSLVADALRIDRHHLLAVVGEQGRRHVLRVDLVQQRRIRPQRHCLGRATASAAPLPRREAQPGGEGGTAAAGERVHPWRSSLSQGREIINVRRRLNFE